MQDGMNGLIHSLLLSGAFGGLGLFMKATTPTVISVMSARATATYSVANEVAGVGMC